MSVHTASDADPDHRPTLAEVAAGADVSLKTASRALSGEPHVSPGTLARVLAEARRLGYQRNAAASLLASGRTVDTIGVLTGDFTNPFYAGLAQGVEDEARGKSIRMAVASTGEDPDTEWELAQNMAAQRAKAVIVVSAMVEHSRYASLSASGTTVVFADRAARGIEADSVVLDNYHGGCLAAQHLLDAGHHRIAYIGDYEWLPTHRDRVAGFGETLAAAGVLRWGGLVRTGVHDVDSARVAATTLLMASPRPTAIVAGNNRIALGVLQSLVALPEARTTAVIGFDDVEWAGIVGLTVIAQDPVAMGRQAARLALARIEDQSRAAQTVVMPTSLTENGSGERRPA